MDTGGGSRAGHADDGGRAEPEGRAVAADADVAPAPTQPSLRHPPGRWRGDGHRAVGLALLAVWLVWLVVTALFQPRTVDDAQFREDIRSGDVVAWRVVDVSRSDDGPIWTGTLVLQMPSVEQDGTPVDDGGAGIRTIAYTTSAPFTRVLDDTTDPLPDQYAAALGVAGVPETASYWDSPRIDAPGWAALPALGLVALFLGALLFGPRPLHGTRWYWFWFVFPTLGLGVVRYAMVEHLRRPQGLPDAVAGRPLDIAYTPRRVAEAGPGSDRRSGLAGLLVSIVLGFATLTALTVLVDATHWVWLVRP